ncbi:5-methylcytosine restriction system specificity protein McrC, partial [Cloacibacillus evryensis]|uniref:5-methylcytosine restriction system specificity protein McrC n=1 Tax=Cloacibacillus evryensis TaxID=508460 RepID=UPI0029BAE79D|nr:5-methylcytosine-specific restriction endonuclease system specificity protein McrC [Cloacibacillus evryensis]
MKNRAALKMVMQPFSDIDMLKIAEIQWERLRYHRNNQTYRMLMNMCHLLLNNLLMSDDKGEIRFAEFIDTQAMPSLYEKFIMEYYKRHFPELHAHASQISWNTDDGYIDFLPTMQTDVSLYYGGKCL